jgi:hypothetical protein
MSAHDLWVPMPTCEQAIHQANEQGAAPAHRLEAATSAHDLWVPTPTCEQAIHQANERACPAEQMPSCRPPPENRPPLLWHEGPVAHVDMFMDDFIGLAQGTQARCQNTRRCILHAVDRVFAMRDEETLSRKEAVSEKKLNKGDGGWCQ